MVTTKTNWSGPNVIHFGRKSQFGPDQFILVETISFWSWPNHYGQVQINLVRPKSFWTDQNCFGHIERQGISTFLIYTNLWSIIPGFYFHYVDLTLNFDINFSKKEMLSHYQWIQVFSLLNTSWDFIIKKSSHSWWWWCFELFRVFENRFNITFISFFLLNNNLISFQKLLYKETCF